MRRTSHILGLSAGVVAVTVLTVVPAAATAPKAGAHYKGHVAGASAGSGVVTFTISKQGTSVTKMRVGPYPVNSCGSGGAPPSQSSKPAPITNGKFTAHVVYSGAGSVIAKATVSGTFLRGGKEKGVVTTVIVGAPKCTQTIGYTAHVT